MENYRKEVAQKFSELRTRNNRQSSKDVEQLVSKYMRINQSVITKENYRLIDIGCGTGDMLPQWGLDQYPHQHGMEVIGIDNSPEMVAEAQRRYPNQDVQLQDACSMRFPKPFHMAVSQYALQNLHADGMLSEFWVTLSRVLYKNAFFVLLVVHPMRQFIERKSSKANYFDKSPVESIIFGGEITVSEPGHSIQDYLSTTFFKLFDLLEIKEGYDFPASEQIGGPDVIYPTYLILVGRNRNLTERISN